MGLEGTGYTKFHALKKINEQCCYDVSIQEWGQLKILLPGHHGSPLTI